MGEICSEIPRDCLRRQRQLQQAQEELREAREFLGEEQRALVAAERERDRWKRDAGQAWQFFNAAMIEAIRQTEKVDAAIERGKAAWHWAAKEEARRNEWLLRAEAAVRR